MYSNTSQADKNEIPTKRLRAPPSSDMKEMVDTAQTSLSTVISVDAKA